MAGPAKRWRRSVAPRRVYRALHNIADGKVGKLESAFLRSVDVAKANVDRAALARALERGDGEAAAAALGTRTSFASTLRRSMTPILATVATSAAVVAAQLETPRMTLRFNVVNPRAVRWAANESATLVSQVTTDTRAMVRDIIRRGQEGITIQQQKRLIREVLVTDAVANYGLTERQYQAVQRYRDRLVKADLDPATIDKRVARYQQQTLNQRATTIARTETIRASTEGQQLAWQEAVDQGYLDGTERREWIVTPDDRLCDFCRAIPGLNPDGAPLQGVFVTPGGGTVTRPPGHPNCRCALALLIPDTATQRAA